MRIIRFTSRADACNTAPDQNWAVISISEPAEGPAPLKEGWEKVLRLVFHDADLKNGIVRTVSATLPGEQYTVFDEAMAKQVVDFYRDNIKDTQLNLLVHCHAGISRSAGVALALSAACDFSKVYMGAVPCDPRYSVYNKHVYRLVIDELVNQDMI